MSNQKITTQEFVQFITLNGWSCYETLVKEYLVRGNDLEIAYTKLVEERYGFVLAWTSRNLGLPYDHGEFASWNDFYNALQIVMKDFAITELTSLKTEAKWVLKEIEEIQEKENALKKKWNAIQYTILEIMDGNSYA